MDLFTNMDENYMRGLKTYLGTWGKLFDSSMLEYVNNILERIQREREEHTVYPPVSKVFRLYNSLPLKDINVVIIGQDPYPNGNANGFAFACEEKLSPTVKQMVAAMKEDLNTIPSGLGNMKLEYLVDQGVFLFNTILTVTDKSMAHKEYGWQTFTSKTIEIINLQRRPIVWMLWGGEARKVSKLITNKEHLILQGSHPVYASRSNTVWKCDHFSRCNDFLQMNGIQKIKWL